MDGSHMPMASTIHGWQMGDCYGKSFACTYKDCDKVFYRKYHLFRHQRQKHLQPLIQDVHGSIDNAVHGSSDNIVSCESVNPAMNQPVQPEYSFPAESLGSSGNLETIAEVHAGPNDVGHGEKRKRKITSFGDDMLMLSPDNDDWTDNSQKVEPVAGCSQWDNYGKELEQDTSVSMFI